MSRAGPAHLDGIGGQHLGMARTGDPGSASIAGPAALLGMALLAMAVHLRQGQPLASSARTILAGSRDQTAAFGAGWLPHPAEVAAALAAAILLGISAAIKLRSTTPVGSGVLGRARRARGRDLRAMRRVRKPGPAAEPRVRLGDHRRRAIWLPGDEHLLALGPTGSGKSSALAIPALLEWPGPVVVTDPKGELVRATLSHRRRLGEVAVFAPLMEPTARWNPVGSIRSSEDALRVATFLMGRSPEREPFWHDLARQLLHGLLIEASELQLAPGGVLELLQSIPAEELPEAVRHPAARRLVQGALSGGDRTAMGVVATLVSQLGAYGTDQVARATSGSDFDPAAIAGGGLRTLYCVVAPHDAPVLRGLISALISCCWRSLFASPPAIPALFVLDEFTQLTNLPELPALVQLGRSQGVRMMLMAQDLGSISAAYGVEAAGALWSNCRTKLLLPGISEIELLERVSKLAGTSTLHRRSEAWTMEAVSSQPLLHPDDVRRLKSHQALLLRGGDQPAVIEQHRWFGDRRLKERATLGEPVQGPAPAPGRPLRDWVDPDPNWTASANPLRWHQADLES
ncbi:MAG TPA: type IV secretory system conjugative DNA transfer family protein [Candidatus Acidoferrales bacterium]|nr:type IV secretory system conjugative DNA transfer family protein [Candidatus Acidoferrales bacterium]